MDEGEEKALKKSALYLVGMVPYLVGVELNPGPTEAEMAALLVANMEAMEKMRGVVEQLSGRQRQRQKKKTKKQRGGEAHSEGDVSAGSHRSQASGWSKASGPAARVSVRRATWSTMKEIPRVPAGIKNVNNRNCSMLGVLAALEELRLIDRPQAVAMLQLLDERRITQPTEALQAVVEVARECARGERDTIPEDVAKQLVVGLENDAIPYTMCTECGEGKCTFEKLPVVQARNPELDLVRVQGLASAVTTPFQTVLQCDGCGDTDHVVSPQVMEYADNVAIAVEGGLTMDGKQTSAQLRLALGPRPVYVGGKVMDIAAIICHRPRWPGATAEGHFVTLFPRPSGLWVVDEDKQPYRVTGQRRNELLDNATTVFLTKAIVKRRVTIPQNPEVREVQAEEGHLEHLADPRPTRGRTPQGARDLPRGGDRQAGAVEADWTSAGNATLTAVEAERRVTGASRSVSPRKTLRSEKTDQEQEEEAALEFRTRQGLQPLSTPDPQPPTFLAPSHTTLSEPRPANLSPMRTRQKGSNPGSETSKLFKRAVAGAGDQRTLESLWKKSDNPRKGTGEYHQDTLRVGVQNIAGWTTHKTRPLAEALDEWKVDVLGVQEIKWKVPNKQCPEGYSIASQVRSEDRASGGGCAQLTKSTISTRDTITYRRDGVEAISQEVCTGVESIRIASVYVAPQDRLTQPDLAALKMEGDGPGVIMGDFNAHHPTWSNGNPTAKGGDLEELMAENGYEVAYDEPQTTKVADEGAPDAIFTRGLETVGTARVLKPSHLSDHRLLCVDLRLDLTLEADERPRRPNWRKADWQLFTDVVNRQLPEPARRLMPRTPFDRGRTIEQAWRVFKDAVLTGQAMIPRTGAVGRGRTTEPSGRTVELRAECDAKWEEFRRTTAGEALEQYHALKARYHESLKEDVYDRVRGTVEKLNPVEAAGWAYAKGGRSNAAKLTGTVIDGASTMSKKAEAFARTYAQVGIKAPRVRRRVGPLRRKTLGPAVTDHEVAMAVKALKLRKACGPDGIYGEALKHLQGRGYCYLREIIRYSVKWGVMPRAWKTSFWVPIAKPGKPPEESKSWRPVSLCSVVAKVAERVVEARIRRLIPPHQLQFAYRSKTEVADLIFTAQDIVNRQFNNISMVEIARDKEDPEKGTMPHPQSGKAAMALFDLTAAFDRVRHDQLIDVLHGKGLPAYLCKWVQRFITTRVARVRLGETLSAPRKIRIGVPQGTVLGPLLFRILVSTLQTRIGALEDTHLLLYADDINAIVCGATEEECAEKLQKVIDEVERWAAAYHMTVNQRKTHVQLLTPTARQVGEHRVVVGGEPKELSTRFNGDDARLLGHVVDGKMCFARHARHVRLAASHAARTLRVTTSKYGLPTHVARTFGVGLVSSRLYYAAGAWGQDLERVGRDTTRSQNAYTQLNKANLLMARKVTGVLRGAQADSALLEANLDPVAVRIRSECCNLVETRAERIEEPLPRPHPRRDAYFGPHPSTNARRNIEETLESRGVPLNHRREPVLLRTSTRPWETTAAFVKRVEIRSEPLDFMDGAHELPPKETEEGKKLRTILNRRTMEYLRGMRFDREIYTDGAVQHVDGRTRSAGGGQLYGPDGLMDEVVVPAGALACSYWAEAVGMRSALARFAGAVAGVGRLLVVTDSQGLLKALEAGPSGVGEQHLDDIWMSLRSIGKRGTHVVLQFVYSHCEVPRNDAIDELLTARLEGQNLRQEDARIWLTDVNRAVHQKLEDDWKRTQAATARVRLCGSEKAPLRATQHLTRQQNVNFARLRTDCHPAFGELRRIINRDVGTNCRFCNEQVPEAHQPAGIFHCPGEGCAYTTPLKQAVRRHYEEEHSVPDTSDQPSPNRCICGRVFAKLKGMSTHRGKCQTWRALEFPRSADGAVVKPAEHRFPSAESAVHFAYECQHFQALRGEVNADNATVERTIHTLFNNAERLLQELGGPLNLFS